MDSSTSENETLNELETIRQQLSTYKDINIGLSQKVQELKEELNAFKQENSQLKKELLEERTRSIEYKRYFTMINQNCINFVNAYVANIQEISENDVTLIENAPVTPRNDDEQQAQFVRVRNVQAIEMNNVEKNVLNTILEESNVPITSTPKPGENRPVIPRPACYSPESSPFLVDFNGSSLLTPKVKLKRISTKANAKNSNKENDTDVNDNDIETNSDEENCEGSILHETIKVLKQQVYSKKSSVLQNIQIEQNTTTLDSNIESSVETSSSRSQISLKPNSSGGNLPKRKARPTTLKEPSLGTKLRRSTERKKDKKG